MLIAVLQILTKSGLLHLLLGVSWRRVTRDSESSSCCTVTGAECEVLVTVASACHMCWQET